MKRALVTAFVALFLGGAAAATPFYVVARYAQTTRNPLAPTHVTIRCDGWTEDSLATLRLVTFERTDETLSGGLRVVYRCVAP